MVEPGSFVDQIVLRLCTGLCPPATPPAAGAKPEAPALRQATPTSAGSPPSSSSSPPKAASAPKPDLHTPSKSAVAAMSEGRAMGLRKSGGDRFLIDIRTGEQVFIERESGRKYRLGASGGKLYEDEKPKKKYGGHGSWMTVEAQSTKGAVAAGQGRARMI